MVFTLAGCGSGSSNSGNTNQGSSNQGSTNQGSANSGSSNTGSSGSGAAAPQRSKIANIGDNAEALNTDPIGSRNATDGKYMAMHYEALIYSERSGRDFDPMLATSWEYNTDATEWTFHLREGVTFHNGQPFDADDAVCSFQYMLDNKDTSSIYLGNLTSLVSVEKVDQYTIKLYCSTPTPLMLNSLLGIYMIPHGVFEELGPEEAFRWQNICGTGPWIMHDWIPGQYTSWVKNENYWNKAKYDSYFEEVRLAHLSEPSSVVAAHIAGDLDAYTPSAGMNPDLIPLYDSVKDRVELVSVVTNSNNLLSMQCGEKSQISDINLRKAVNHAIDRELMVRTLHNGIGAPSNSYYHPMTPGYDPTLTDYRYDPDLAKEYLAKSIYDGRTLHIMTRSVTTRETNEALAVSDMLAKVGIVTEVQPVDSMTFQTRSSEGDFDMIYTSGPIGNNEPGPQWNRFMTTVAKNNNFSDDIAFGMMREYLKEPDRAKRIELGTKIVRRLNEVLAPYIWTIHPSTFYARNYGITGLILAPDGGAYHTYIDWDPSYTATSGTSAPTYINIFRMD
jgi:peptide/nickel transport system substrate-binding protein/glutathione transport system substrate-binding protein